MKRQRLIQQGNLGIHSEHREIQYIRKTHQQSDRQHDNTDCFLSEKIITSYLASYTKIDSYGL